MLQRLILVAVCVVSITSPDVRAAESDESEAVARRALSAIKQNRIEDFAKAMHPDALVRFRSTLLEIVKEAEKSGGEEQLLPLFDGVRTTQELRKLDTTHFFVAFYSGLIQMAPELETMMAGAELEILGHVMEGPDTSHVVYRMVLPVETVRVTKITVVSLTRTPTGWGMLLTGDIEGMVGALRQRFDVQQK